MNIFIDESGTFTGSQGHHSVSVVGALIVPDARYSRIEKAYAKLRSSLPKEKGEVKGRLLSERDIDAVVSMLARNEVLFEIDAFDMAIHTTTDIADHQRRQAEGITKHVTDKYHPNLRGQLFDLRHRLEKMTPQLYVQSVMMFDLISAVIEHATLFYSQRMPRELGAFHWVIDGKDKGRITDWENWWSRVVMPIIQSQSLKKPMAMFEGGDYSHFERFRTTIPEYMKPHVPRIPERRRNDASDLRKMITESFRFSSNPEVGLEVVDILVNATRRALTGNLDGTGWRNIPRLMIHRAQQYIRMVSLSRTVLSRQQWPYMDVLRRFSQGGKDMIAPRFQRGRQGDSS
jgi:hypothetical protein